MSITSEWLGCHQPRQLEQQIREDLRQSTIIHWCSGLKDSRNYIDASAESGCPRVWGIPMFIFQNWSPRLDHFLVYCNCHHIFRFSLLLGTPNAQRHVVPLASHVAPPLGATAGTAVALATVAGGRNRSTELAGRGLTPTTRTDGFVDHVCWPFGSLQYETCQLPCCFLGALNIFIYSWKLNESTRSTRMNDEWSLF